jgi:hypothetical protein
VTEHEAYQRMRASLDDAHAQAERLVREADAQAQARADAPPRGWSAPDPEEPRRAAPGVSELQALAGLIELARQSVPPELTRQVLDALRQLLLAIRALIDFYLERLEGERDATPKVEDIPIQ